MAINSAKKRVCFSTGKNMLNSLRNLHAACIAPIYTMYGKRSKHLAQYFAAKENDNKDSGSFTALQNIKHLLQGIGLIAGLCLTVALVYLHKRAPIVTE